MWWNSATHTGYGAWGAVHFVDTYDDAGFAYDFRGGEECMILQSRLGTAWYSWMIDDWEGMTGFVEDASKIGVLQDAAGGTGTRTLRLDTGEAANFTVNGYYYIMDFNGVSQVDYVKVTARDLVADTVTVENLSYNFAAGSLIGAYIHRWWANRVIPYMSSTTPAYAFGDSGGAMQFDYFGITLAAMTPNDDGYYGVMRPIIVERYNYNGWQSGNDMNRAYGRPKNFYITIKLVMAPGLDGRTINGDNWLYFKTMDTYGQGSSSAYAALMRDSTHTS